MISRAIDISMEEELWTLLDQLEYTIRQRATDEGRKLPLSYRRITSAVLKEALLAHAEEIQRDYEEARRNSLLVRIANLNRDYRDPELADAVRADGGRPVSYLPAETEGPLRGAHGG